MNLVGAVFVLQQEMKKHFSYLLGEDRMNELDRLMIARFSDVFKETESILEVMGKKCKDDDIKKKTICLLSGAYTLIKSVPLEELGYALFRMYTTAMLVNDQDEGHDALSIGVLAGIHVAEQYVEDFKRFVNIMNESITISDKSIAPLVVATLIVDLSAIMNSHPISTLSCLVTLMHYFDNAKIIDSLVKLGIYIRKDIKDSGEGMGNPLFGG